MVNIKTLRINQLYYYKVNSGIYTIIKYKGCVEKLGLYKFSIELTFCSDKEKWFSKTNMCLDIKSVKTLKEISKSEYDVLRI